MTLQTGKKQLEIVRNPFPGLRPFTREESHLFFGREGQIENVSDKLLKNRFVAVIGSSGSGKSSLIYCGVLSKITAKGKWDIMVTRPGTKPFSNLLQSVTGSVGTGMDTKNIPVDGAERLIQEYLENKHRDTGVEFLLLIDQFEELFRYSLGNETSDPMAERSDYADFLVKLAAQDKIPVNIIITMRSDFIGECSRFQSFTSLINKSNYLIPRMSRENFHSVIVEPVRIAGAEIEEKLCDRILDQMGDNQDQLPILQHALMRTWNYWKDNSAAGKAISLNDYEAVGGIERALSDHANEAFDELSLEEKTGCEKIFRTLTEKGMDNRGVRRPTTVSRLAGIAEISEEKVIKIVDVFRAEGRSFLTPAQHIELKPDSVIDLSHEALMRIWDRLDNWVEEEASAVTMYKRLSETAGLYQTGKSSLWRPPDLQLAINWKIKNKPNLAWAERHDPAFERAMVFLNTSQEEFEKAEANKLRLQRLRLRRTRLFALILGTAAIISLVMFLWTRQLSVDLEQQIIIAENERNVAQQKTVEAEEQRGLAQQRFEEAERERQRADTAAMIAEERRIQAEENARIAASQTELAKANLNEANRQSAIARQNAIEAERRKKEAEDASLEAFSRRMLSIAASLAVKSVQISSDPDLKSLLSLQAYKYNLRYAGDPNDMDIYTGLYAALKAKLGMDYNQYRAHDNAVRSVCFLPSSTTFLSSGSDGKILAWNLDDPGKTYQTICEGRNVIEKIAVSADGKFMLAAENRNGLLLIKLDKTGTTPSKLAGLESNIRNIAMSHDSRYAWTSGLENFIEEWDLASGKSRKFTETGTRINALAVSPAGNLLAAGTKDGKVLIWQTRDEKTTRTIFEDQDNAVQSLSFSPDGKFLALGLLNGSIRILRSEDFQPVANLTRHLARVTDMSFSPDSKKMVSTSYDGKVLFWDMTDFTNPPVEFTDNSGFGFSASFSNDGKYFVCGSAEDARLIVRPSTSQMLFEKLCPLISRNLRKDEWDLYVGEDIELEETCSSN